MSAQKYLDTPRGKLRIEKCIESAEKAKEQGYGYYFTHKEHDIYAFHYGINCCHFALVPNGR